MCNKYFQRFQKSDGYISLPAYTGRHACYVITLNDPGKSGCIHLTRFWNSRVIFLSFLYETRQSCDNSGSKRTPPKSYYCITSPCSLYKARVPGA